MVTASTPSGSYLEVFDEFRNLAFGRDPVWSRNLREDAMAMLDTVIKIYQGRD